VTICSGPFKIDENNPLNRDFHINPNLEELLNRYRISLDVGNTERVKLQLRCMKLNPSNLIQKDYENSFPKLCEFSFNTIMKKTFKTEPPPNHEKKRKDEMINLTESIKRNKNHISVIKKAEQSDPTAYICGIFVVKAYNSDEVISFIESQNDETFTSSFQFVKEKLLPSEVDELNEDDDLIFERKVDFTLA
jgi:hypothetical protein